MAMKKISFLFIEELLSATYAGTPRRTEHVLPENSF
jgi:hypothetical protein